MAMTPAGLPSTPTKIAVAPSCAQTLGRVGERGRVDACAPSGTWRCRCTTGWPSTVPITPLPVGASKSRDRRRARVLRSPPRRRWPRPADARSPARRSPQAAAPRPRRIRRRLRSRSPSACPSVSVPVLSTTSVSTFSMRSSASAFLISTPALRAAPDADHDRHRRGEAQRAGAGDDQHADRGDQRRRRSAAPARTSPRRRRRPAPRRSPSARTSRRPGRPAAGSARGCAAPRPPSARSATAACRGRPCRRA